MLLACLLIVPLWANMTLGGGNAEFLVGLLAISAGSMAIAGLLGTPVAIVSTLYRRDRRTDRRSPVSLVVLVIFSSLAGIMALPAIWPSRHAWPAVLALVAIEFPAAPLPAGLADRRWLHLELE